MVITFFFFESSGESFLKHWGGSRKCFPDYYRVKIESDYFCTYEGNYKIYVYFLKYALIAHSFFI